MRSVRNTAELMKMTFPIVSFLYPAAIRRYTLGLTDRTQCLYPMCILIQKVNLECEMK